MLRKNFYLEVKQVFSLFKILKNYHKTFSLDVVYVRYARKRICFLDDLCCIAFNRSYTYDALGNLIYRQLPNGEN